MYSAFLLLPRLQYLWYEVFLQTQAVTDINILDKTEFQTHEVVDLLMKSNINPAFKAKKAIGTVAKKRSAAQFREILNVHSDNKAPQTFQHVVKINRSISCSGLNCKTLILVGN